MIEDNTRKSEQSWIIIFTEKIFNNLTYNNAHENKYLKGCSNSHFEIPIKIWSVLIYENKKRLFKHIKTVRGFYGPLKIFFVL